MVLFANEVHGTFNAVYNRLRANRACRTIICSVDPRTQEAMDSIARARKSSDAPLQHEEAGSNFSAYRYSADLKVYAFRLVLAAVVLSSPYSC